MHLSGSELIGKKSLKKNAVSMRMILVKLVLSIATVLRVAVNDVRAEADLQECDHQVSIVVVDDDVGMVNLNIHEVDYDSRVGGEAEYDEDHS